MANETILVDLGPAHPGLVVRLPPLEPTFPEYELAPQALVQNAVAAAGVPAPAPSDARPTEWIGSDFLVMPRIAGDVPGGAPFSIPTCATLGPHSNGSCMISSSTWSLACTTSTGRRRAWVRCCPGRSCATRSSGGWRMWHGRRRATRSRRWRSPWTGALDTSRPSVSPCCCGATCAWATSSSIPERRVTAVLDWDLASIGPREMDLGWHIGLEFMMDALFGGRLPGFPARPRCWSATDAAAATRRGTCPGTRCSRWRARWPSTTATSASRRTSGGGRTRWVTSSWRAGGGVRNGQVSSENPMTPALATS